MRIVWKSPKKHGMMNLSQCRTAERYPYFYETEVRLWREVRFGKTFLRKRFWPFWLLECCFIGLGCDGEYRSRISHSPNLILSACWYQELPLLAPVWASHLFLTFWFCCQFPHACLLTLTSSVLSPMWKALSIKALLQVGISPSKCFYITQV